jgi:hypothetical protein
MEGHSTPLAPASGVAAVRRKLSAKLQGAVCWARRLVLVVEKQFSAISIFCSQDRSEVASTRHEQRKDSDS